MAAVLYATLSDLKARLQITSSAQDTVLSDLLSVASRSVEDDCNRVFSKSSTVETRRFNGNGLGVLLVSDIASLTGLVISVDGVELSSSDYFTTPDAIVEKPVYALERAGGNLWTFGQRNVSVTALWGWPSVPEAARQATLYRAAQLYRDMNQPDFAGETIGDYTYRRWTPENIRERNKIQVAAIRRNMAG